MSRPTRITVAVLCAVALGAATGCAGDDTVVVTQTVPRTDTTIATGTPTTPTTPTTSTTVTPPTEDATDELALRLPPPTAIPKVKIGTVGKFPTAEGLINTLYRPGDASAPAAIVRLQNSGYSGGALRDQPGTAPLTDLALLRTYVFRLGSVDEATNEVTRGVAEVRATSPGALDAISLPDVPTAEGVSGKVTENGQALQLVFITFSAGQDVFGLQAIAADGANIYRPKLEELAKQLYIAYGLNP